MKCTLLIAATVLACAAQTVSAGFTFSDTRTPLAGSTTHERIVVSAFNNGADKSTSLLAMELWVTSSKPMTFNYADLNGDGRTDVNMTAPTATLGNANITGTKVADELFGFMFESGFDFDPTPRHISTPTHNAVAAYTNSTAFYALGATLITPPIVANQGSGAKFLSVVAPIGTTLTLTGGIADEIGNISSALTANSSPFANVESNPTGIAMDPFSYVSAVPEPTTLASLAIGGMLLRRRRAI